MPQRVFWKGVSREEILHTSLPVSPQAGMRVMLRVGMGVLDSEVSKPGQQSRESPSARSVHC